jgi:Mor family transcriptional regulator
MKTSTQEILAFIDAAKRLPNDEKKTLWVRWLVNQYELRCQATVIKGKQRENTDHCNSSS